MAEVDAVGRLEVLRAPGSHPLPVRESQMRASRPFSLTYVTIVAFLSGGVSVFYLFADFL